MKVYRRERDLTLCQIVGVCATTREQFVRELFELPVEPVSATVVLIGIPAVVSAAENQEYAQMYNSATFAAIDGMPIVKMARRRGFECERCSGPDIMGLVFEESIRRGKTHYFYGGINREALEKMRLNIERDYPGIKIVGMYAPPFRPLTDEEDQSVCAEINSLRPDFVWVGIGAPKQEMWMWQHQEKLRGTIMLGVGAAFNFLAGTVDKAPKWIENAGLEWLYRLIKEPKRLWRRYIIGGMKFVGYCIKEKIAR